VAPLNKDLGEKLKAKYTKEVEAYESDKGTSAKRRRTWKMSAFFTVSQAIDSDGGEALLNGL